MILSVSAVRVLPLLTLLCYLDAFKLNDADQSSREGYLFAKASLSNNVDSTDIVSNLESVKDSSFLKDLRSGTFPTFSQLRGLSGLFDFPPVEETARTENVPVSIAPFKVILRPFVEQMPLTTMEFPYLNFTFPINIKAKHNSPYTPLSFEYPEPKSYTGDDMPTLDEIYDNPRMIEGFEFNYAHPTNRDIVVRLVDVGKKSLQVIRSIPQFHLPEDGEPGFPIDISKMQITVEGYPYEDATLVFPASKLLLPAT